MKSLLGVLKLRNSPSLKNTMPLRSLPTTVPEGDEPAGAAGAACSRGRICVAGRSCRRTLLPTRQ